MTTRCPGPADEGIGRVWPGARPAHGGGLTGGIDEAPEDQMTDPDLDPERLAGCAYWRCGELFEQRSANQRFCRKACRSRQGTWERAQARRAARAEAKLRRRRA